MSQIYKSSLSSPQPPQAAEQFNTQDGNSIPLANIEIINGFQSSENNLNGIITKGGVAGTGTQNEVDIVLTNRYSATLTTTNATPTLLVSVPTPLFPAVYNFTGTVSGYDVTGNLGAVLGYSFSFRTTAGPGISVPLAPDILNVQEDATFTGTILITQSGTSQLFQITVTGVTGHTIDWLVVGTYTVIN